MTASERRRLREAVDRERRARIVSESARRESYDRAPARVTAATLEQPEWQPLIARVGSSIGEVADGIDRIEYVERICMDVISARLHPRHRYPTRRGR